MRSVDGVRLARVLMMGAALLLAACGGGNSTVTTITGGGTGLTVSVDQPTGDNTTEVIVDAGPTSGFTSSVNLPYATVTVCEPGSSTHCASVDHVFIDTGSIGLRLLRSAVQSLNLQVETVAAGKLLECYPFVIGAVWGPVASADVRIAGELAGALPVQLIDDQTPKLAEAPADCVSLAGGSLMQSSTTAACAASKGLA
jgi:hypothetical protein